ncbi:MAG: type I-E CRISPR-associated protein Cse1/CasA [Candidatus Ornithospirochaeta sp.]
MNRFNLTTEHWIPLEGGAKASLCDMYSPDTKGLISGNAIQKISLYKLLFCIAQDAVKAKNSAELERLGIEKFGKTCIEYLNAHYDCFWLYGDKPFLQYPELINTKVEDKEILCSYIPDLSAENDTVIRDTQTDPPNDDGEKAVFILGLMSYALGGKRVSNPALYLTSNTNRSKSAKSAPSLGGGSVAGYQQSIIVSDSILKTVFLNYFTSDEIAETGFSMDEASAPWIKMPTLENSDYNECYKKSVFPWYLAMSRDVLLTEKGIRYCEGISYTDKWFEPFISKNADDKILLVDTQKKPWKDLPALLEEAKASNSSKSNCMAISTHLKRAKKYKEKFGILTGGLRVRGNSGDQSIKQSDDFVESLTYFDPDQLGDEFYQRYRDIIEATEFYGKVLYSSIRSYYTDLGFDKKNELAKNAMNIYWNTMNQISQEMADASDSDEATTALKKSIFRNVLSIYDNECQKLSARQLIAWNKNRPFSGKENKK